MRARSIVGAGLVLLALTTFGCDDDQGQAEPPGTGAPAFEGAPELISILGELAIECSSERTFDPLDNVAPDGVDYPTPEARICLSQGSDLYVLVYEREDHRVEAIENGEVNLNLCAFAASDDPDPDNWRAVVGANWRVASPAPNALLNAALSGIEGSAAERISCVFEE